MTRQWTITESRKICRRVFSWPTTTQNDRLFLIYPSDRPAWMPTCAIPDWPSDPTAAAMALAELSSKGGLRYEGDYDMLARCHTMRLSHQSDGRYPVEGVAPTWPAAVMLAVLAGVKGK